MMVIGMKRCFVSVSDVKSIIGLFVLLIMVMEVVLL